MAVFENSDCLFLIAKLEITLRGLLTVLELNRGKQFSIVFCNIIER